MWILPKNTGQKKKREKEHQTRRRETYFFIFRFSLSAMCNNVQFKFRKVFVIMAMGWFSVCERVSIWLFVLCSVIYESISSIKIMIVIVLIHARISHTYFHSNWAHCTLHVKYCLCFTHNLSKMRFRPECSQTSKFWWKNKIQFNFN